MDSRKYLNQFERNHLEMILRERLESDLRNATALLVLLYTGMRATEMLNLTWHEIDVQTGAVYVRTLKRGRDREVQVPTFIRKALVQLKELNPERPFPISYNRLGEVWREYRPAHKPLHALRHTFAIDGINKTGNVHFVQRALGHRSIQNTMVYADYAYTAREFKKLMRYR